MSNQDILVSISPFLQTGYPLDSQPTFLENRQLGLSIKQGEINQMFLIISIKF